MFIFGDKHTILKYLDQFSIIIIIFSISQVQRSTEISDTPLIEDWNKIELKEAK